MLDVPDVAFDVVRCQLGLPFFPDKVRALTEVRRALRIGDSSAASARAVPPPFFAAPEALMECGADGPQPTGDETLMTCRTPSGMLLRRYVCRECDAHS